MSLNVALLRMKIEKINESLERLKRIRGVPVADFLNNQDLKDIACFRLLVVIEDALAVCFHISAKNMKRIPTEYAECFQILGQEGIVTKDLADRLSLMARFRNILVHQYWEVDYKRVYAIIQDDLGHIEAFLASIEKLL
jgi:uncharacterized protein YutE (UPF0331/DUF86 family)